MTAKVSSQDPNDRFKDFDGVPPVGRTLGSYLDDFGGFRGRVDDPLGTWHDISLEGFEGADRDDFLEIRFYLPSEGHGFPPLEEGETVLKEFSLPDGVQVPYPSAAS